MVRDAFPLPRIHEALQAVHSSNWFSSFDLTQGYLQRVMEESDIKRLHLEPVEWVCMSSLICHSDSQNAGSSFYCLMEQCLGYQQFVTLLLYLNDICSFAPTIDDMLN